MVSKKVIWFPQPRLHFSSIKRPRLLFFFFNSQLFAEGEVHIAEYLLRRSRGKHSAIFAEPEVNNCFSIIFKGECEELEEI